MRHFKAIFLLAAIPFCFLFQDAKCQAGPDDYLFHSVFIYSFSRYIEWPKEDGEFKIGVVGGSLKLEESLEKMANSKSTENKKYIIKVVHSLEEADEYQMLVFPKNHTELFEKYAIKLKEKPVLLITENEEMISRGANINFVRIDQKLQYEIDQKRIEEKGMKVSSKLVTMSYQK
jgi:hypothetical protein